MSFERREPLSVERIVAAAVAAADAGGLDAVSMRNVANALGVEAMSLYHHIANKAALIRAVVDAFYDELDVPVPKTNWREALRQHARSLLQQLRAHPWALALVDTQADPGERVLQRHDLTLGVLLADGLSIEMALHAYSLVDSYVYGTALTQQNLPFDAEDGSEFAGQFALDTKFPNLMRALTEVRSRMPYDYTEEFDFGLELILDGIERMRAQE